MTYLDLIRDADYKLEHGRITLGEYDKMIEPLKTEIPKVGRWIPVGDMWRCSECKELSCCQGNFCSDCGAKMEVNDNA